MLLPSKNTTLIIRLLQKFDLPDAICLLRMSNFFCNFAGGNFRRFYGAPTEKQIKEWIKDCSNEDTNSIITSNNICTKYCYYLTIKEPKRMDGKRKIIVVSVLITTIFCMSCAHSSSPDLLGYDIEYLAGYYYWKHNEAPAKIDDVILAYEELRQEWSHNPHETTYNYLCEHQKLLFLFAYKDRCYYVDLYNIGYHVILLEKDSFSSTEMPSSPPILDVGIMHELDSFIEGGTWHDTTMVTIWFDSTKTGQFVKMSRWELDIITREEKAEIESQHGDCPFLFTDDDYYGYTTLTRNDTVLVVLVFKGLKGRWEHIPSSLVDCSRLIPMDSLLWRPRNFFVPEGAFYDPVVKRYRIEILQSLGSDNGIKDSVVITFDGEEFV